MDVNNEYNIIAKMAKIIESDFVSTNTFINNFKNHIKILFTENIILDNHYYDLNDLIKKLISNLNENYNKHKNIISKAQLEHNNSQEINSMDNDSLEKEQIKNKEIDVIINLID